MFTKLAIVESNRVVMMVVKNPKIIAAKIVPLMFPAPPTMTTTNAVQTTEWPIYGWTDIIGAMKAPAAPAIAEPMNIAAAAVFLGLIP